MTRCDYSGMAFVLIAMNVDDGGGGDDGDDGEDDGVDCSIDATGLALAIRLFVRVVSCNLWWCCGYRWCAVDGDCVGSDLKLRCLRRKAAHPWDMMTTSCASFSLHLRPSWTMLHQPRPALHFRILSCLLL